VKGRHIVARVLGRTIASLAVLLASSVGLAQTNPKFEFAKAEAVKTVDRVEWKTQAKAGASVTAGNSQAKSATMGLVTSRKEGSNKVAVEGALAYGTTNVLTPVVDTTVPTMPMITALDRRTVTSTNNWVVKGRYDRFFTTNNSAYASAQSAADKIAGKTFYGGGQVGYSRQLVNDTMNLVVAEIGYDYSYERYVQQTGKTIDPVSVHSARVFGGETLKLGAATAITASVEALFNVNKEDKALNHTNGAVGVDPFHDTRVIGKAALTTTVWKSLSVAFGFTLKYDQNPAPLPIPGTAPAGSTYSAAAFSATGGIPFAETVDTLTEATLIYSFL
jgi:hypothetical protein